MCIMTCTEAFLSRIDYSLVVETEILLSTTSPTVLRATTTYCESYKQGLVVPRKDIIIILEKKSFKSYFSSELG